MSPPWLSIIGIGEDGIEGLSPAARGLIAQASLVIGGERHLRLADRLIIGERRVWPRPMEAALPDLLTRKPAPVVVLASGDPFWFGVGPMLAKAADAWRCVPQPSSLSLACARLGWSADTATTISFCGRPLAPLGALLQQGRRVIALSENGETPAAVAALLAARGYGPSEIVVLEAMGGPEERVRTAIASSFDLAGIHALNLLAITLQAEPGLRALPVAAGLDDALFSHDGQLTKREIRAATLAALAAQPGELLWDIGAGAGSIAIEWLRQHPSLSAIAIEERSDRLARMAANATRLGTPGLRLVPGSAPEVLAGLPVPDAVFIGGGAGTQGVVETAWTALRPGGRMVINAVTIETEAVLFGLLREHGGTLTRIGVERLVDVGTMHGFRPAMTVTQWAAVKP
jgi:precorrin-6Y C5,15-methyltransferase (decarboxylating)